MVVPRDQNVVEAPMILDTLQEQLGLMLERRTGPVFVIEQHRKAYARLTIGTRARPVRLASRDACRMVGRVETFWPKSRSEAVGHSCRLRRRERSVGE